MKAYISKVNFVVTFLLLTFTRRQTTVLHQQKQQKEKSKSIEQGLNLVQHSP